MAYLGSNPTSSPLTEAQLAFDVATQAELDSVDSTKQDTLVSGTNVKTINSNSLVGSGDLAVGIGEGQTWQDVTASRSAGVTYTNTTGKAIILMARASSTAGYSFSVSVDDKIVDLFMPSTNNYQGTVHAIISNNSTYRLNASGSGFSKKSVYELR